VFDTSCSAVCTCKNGFGGNDCSLNAALVSERDSVRAQLCQALVTAATVQDKSTSLLSTLIASLLSSFSPDEVSVPSSQLICGQALTVLSNLSSNGYIEDTATSLLLAQVISSFAVKASTNFTGGRRLATSTSYPVDSAVLGLVQGVTLGMASGEAPVALATTNVQVRISNPNPNPNSTFTSPKPQP
jgi:hypothetical protein